MKNPTVGALHIHDDQLCYAEVVATEEGPSVGTVGHRGLDGGRAAAFLAGDGELPRELRDCLGEVRDALSGAPGRVVVPPSAVYSFMVPLPAEADARERRQHVLQQTALVTGTGMVSDLHVSASEVRPAPDRDGRPYEWVHVLAVPAETHAQLRAAFDRDDDEWAWMVSSEAAAHVPRPNDPAPDAPFTLLVGAYDSHTEFSLVQETDWYHDQYTEAPEHPDDLGYSLRSFLNGVDVSPTAVSAVATYGAPMTSAHRSVVEDEVGRRPAILDPFSELQGGPPEIEQPATFAPCVGAALHALGD